MIALHRFTTWARTSVVVVLALQVGSCSGSPMAPPPPPPPPPPNVPPVIASIGVSASRLEVGEEVTLSAVVTDAETNPDQLRYEWSAVAGTFSGEGASVRWLPPANRATPENYTLTLTVVEQYGTPNAQGVRPENRVTGASGPVRVHNSQKEVEDMGIRFLRLFADFRVSPDACVVEFTDSCPGKTSERADIAYNREFVEIHGADLTPMGANILSRHAFAETFIGCEFESTVIKCDPADGLQPCAPGLRERARGTCYLTARYEQDRWWLCDSNFLDGVRERFINGVRYRMLGPGAYGR